MIRVRVPATSANCGVGFDTMGLALDWLAEFEFERSEALAVSGCDPAWCNDSNLVWQAYLAMCADLEVEPAPLSIAIKTDIPLARGLGSSATCIVAGCAAAFAIHDLDIDKSRLLSVAARMEGHPDNVAPAIYGGLCCSVMDGDAILLSRIELEDWKFLALVPDYPVKTADARKVLPPSVSHHEAAVQAGNAVLFFEGMRTGNEKQVKRALSDILHEPYRKALIPDYVRLLPLAPFPFWISGSGSTILGCAQDSAVLSSFGKSSGLAWRLCTCCNTGLEVMDA